MKLTIGMAVYNDFKGLYFTLQALRVYHDLRDVELLVVDNTGDKEMQNWLTSWMPGLKYESYTASVGTTQPRQRVFDIASGDFVICVDSHVLLTPQAVSKTLAWIDANPACDDLFHGPMVYDDGHSYVLQMNPAWRDNMWGTWGDQVHTIPPQPFEIPMHGLGLFGARRASWLGFNPDFRGFGGEEGYIHEKYRKHGRKVICLPWLQWYHFFNMGRFLGTGYPVRLLDRVRNYLLGFRELDLDPAPVIEHFGKRIVEQARNGWTPG